MGQFRILSLDGGGPWALIQVKALIDLYGAGATGHTVLGDFDFIAANSGGTITLGGLIKNLALSDILSYFADPLERRKVFVRASFFADPFAHLTRLAGVGPRWNAAAKLAGLKALLGDVGDILVSQIPALIGDNYNGRKPDVVFCAFDYDLNREIFFRSDIRSLAASGSAPRDVTLAIAIHASSNAPVNYFDAPAIGPNATRYWDGALGGYNNPVLAAVIEALANRSSYGIAASDVRALSIGTANLALPLQRGVPDEDPNLIVTRQSSTIIKDLKKLATSILDDPPDAASFHAHVMLNGKLSPPVTDGPIVRMNPLVQPVRGPAGIGWAIPPGLNADEFTALVNMPMDAIEPDQVCLISKFCSLWLKDDVPNQPIRANGDTLAAEIGHGRYSAARKAWMALSEGAPSSVT